MLANSSNRFAGDSKQNLAGDGDVRTARRFVHARFAIWLTTYSERSPCDSNVGVNGNSPPLGYFEPFGISQGCFGAAGIKKWDCCDRVRGRTRIIARVFWRCGN